MGLLKLKTASGGSLILSPTDSAVDTTITVPAVSGAMLTDTNISGVVLPGVVLSNNSAVRIKDASGTARSVITLDSSDIVTIQNNSGDNGGIVSINSRASGLYALQASPSGDVTCYNDIQSASQNGGPLAGFRNHITNGDMKVSQRGTSFPALAINSFAVDRWRVGGAALVPATVSQELDGPVNGHRYSLRVTVTTADSSVDSTDSYALVQTIEGYDARDLLGQTFTLSFWVRSSKTGVHCCAFRTAASTTSYVTEYTVNAANTWEKKSVSVIGGLTSYGTPDWTNGVGLVLSFALQIGTTLHTTKYAWQIGSFLGTANQVNCLDTIGNIFAITGVQLELGLVATPFEFRPYSVELALCQRYYQRIRLDYAAPGTAGKVYSELVCHPPMRATPSWLAITAGSLLNNTAPPAYGLTTSQTMFSITASSTNDVGVSGRIYESTGTEL